MKKRERKLCALFQICNLNTPVFLSPVCVHRPPYTLEERYGQGPLLVVAKDEAMAGGGGGASKLTQA